MENRLAAAAGDFSYLQDVFGNVPMVKRYSLLCLFFSLDTSQSSILREVEQVLRTGLDTLADAVLHLKGHVVFEGKSEHNNWGQTKVLPLSDKIHLSLKDLRHSTDFPSMVELKQEGYPFEHLDRKILVPEDALPVSYTADVAYQESAKRPACVLAVQATVLADGVVLTFASNHTMMDMNGLGQTICLFAKACRNEPFTTDELSQANQTRSGAIPILDDSYQPGPEADDFTFRPRPHISGPPGCESPPIWSYIAFSIPSLAKLKSTASAQTLVPYITTNDAISAFFWRLITKARSQRLGGNVPSIINRQLSARRLLGLNDGYMGHMTASALNHAVDVYIQPLSTVTAHLRQSLQDTATLKHRVLAMATMLTRATDKTTIGYGASLNAERDVILSSWAEIKVCQPETSFGSLLGVADAARRPRANLSPGLVYIMPKDADGSMVAAVCLREIDMAKIRDDNEFKEYAVYLG